MLCHSNTRMAQHFRYILNRNLISKSNSCSKCVPSQVESDRLRKEKQTEED